MFIVHSFLAALMEKIFTSESFTSRDGVLVITVAFVFLLRWS